MSTRLVPCLLMLIVCPLAFSASREEEAKKNAANLKNKDAKVRATAASELGKLGQLQRKLAAPYVSDLMRVLTDSDAKVRSEAAQALGLIDPEDKKEAIERLSEILKSEKSELARSGQERGIGELGGSSEDTELRRMAREALQAAGKKADSKGEKKNIKTAMEMITGPRKKN